MELDPYKKLVEYVESVRHKPFEWGVHDCCLFAANTVLEMTGTDPAKDYRGYTDRQSAEAMLETNGGVEGIAEKSGFPEVDPKFAQRGDVVLIENHGKPALGICMGVNIAATGVCGLAFIPMSEAKRAWKCLL